MCASYHNVGGHGAFLCIAHVIENGADLLPPHFRAHQLVDENVCLAEADDSLLDKVVLVHHCIHMCLRDNRGSQQQHEGEEKAAERQLATMVTQ